MKLPAGASHEQALQALVNEFRNRQLLTGTPKAIGHRVVHGGETFREAVLVDDATEQAIEACAELAPLHNPVNLAGIRAMRALFPDRPHAAVFDTAYHPAGAGLSLCATRALLYPMGHPALWLSRHQSLLYGPGGRKAAG